MLGEVLKILEKLSPRLCRLISQVWDLVCLNMFVLLQLSASAFDEIERLQLEAHDAAKVHEEVVELHTERIKRYETETQNIRSENEKLSAQLYTCQRKLKRSEAENATLQKAVQELQHARNAVSRSGSIAPAVETEGEGVQLTNLEQKQIMDIQPADAEEDEEDWTSRTQIEIVGNDIDVLFASLLASECRLVEKLDDLDRHVDSEIASILWKQAADIEVQQSKYRLLSMVTQASQTDGEPLSSTASFKQAGSHRLVYDDNTSDIGQRSSKTQPRYKVKAGVSSLLRHSSRATVLPPSLAIQFSTRPLVTSKYMDKRALIQELLWLLLCKVQIDAIAIKSLQGRPDLHTSLKEAMHRRYTSSTLSDLHLAAIIKSCMHYRDQIAYSEEERLGDSEAEHWFLMKELKWEDIRLEQFCRLCQLVQVLDTKTSVQISSSVLRFATNSTIDMLADIVELEIDTPSLQEAVYLFGKEAWMIDLETASTLMYLHFGQHGHDARKRLLYRLPKLEEKNIGVDSFLALHFHLCLELDAELRAQIQTAVASIDEDADTIDDLEHVMSTILNESLRAEDSRKLLSTFESLSRTSLVQVAMDIIHRKKTCFGMRTNRRPLDLPPHLQRRIASLCLEDQVVEDKLKPGLDVFRL